MKKKQINEELKKMNEDFYNFDDTQIDKIIDNIPLSRSSTPILDNSNTISQMTNKDDAKKLEERLNNLRNNRF